MAAKIPRARIGMNDTGSDRGEYEGNIPSFLMQAKRSRNDGEIGNGK
jgi:hypothetical protein